MTFLGGERIVARVVEHLAYATRYALDPRLIEWTSDRRCAYRFATHTAARRAIDDACRTLPDSDPDWIDPYLAAPFRVWHPTIELDAAAAVAPILHPSPGHP